MFIKTILSLLFTVSLVANNIDLIQNNFTSIMSSVLETVSNKQLDSKSRNDIIVSTIDPIFDFKLMAKLTLGRKWKTISRQNQNEFVKLYVNRIKKSYSTKLDKFTNEKISIINVRQIKLNRASLTTRILQSDKIYKITYKFWKPKYQKTNKKQWLIYDVIISGVSIIKTDRAQFKSILKESTIEELMDKLRF